MDHNESANEGGSSAETVIGRSSPEEERKKRQMGSSGEYATVGDSSSSLDTAISITGAAGSFPTSLRAANSDASVTKAADCGAGKKVADDASASETSSRLCEGKKKGRFSALKSSFRMEGGFFKMKKKHRTLDAEPSTEAEPEDDEKETGRKGVHQQLEDEEEDRKTTSSSTASPSGSLKKKKKKRTARSLVRKLSLSKFGLSSGEQQTHLESRHTPEGGDSSQSLSQSSQESPSRHADSPYRTQVKGEEEKTSGFLSVGDEARKSAKPIEKPVSTVTVVHRKSPSLTIRSNPAVDLTSRNRQHDSQQGGQESSIGFRSSGTQCTSTLPYAISKWPDQQQETSESKDPPSEIFKKVKLSVKSESESLTCGKPSSPVELRRKLSLLEEKRAIFQRRFFDATEDPGSGETVIDKEPGRSKSESDGTRKRARHISVRKFDTFSTFDGTFDEETGLGYLAGIEEDHTESYDQQNDAYENRTAAMGPMVGDAFEKTRSMSQESASSQNNAPNAGVGEKREHLYKILVIGELGAGKTSIIKRYVHQFFSQHYRATIGVDFALKVLNWDPHTIIRLQLWDIAGQERFGNMTRVYYKEAVGAFIVFDVTRSATLDAVVKWKQDLDSKVQLPDGSPIPCVLLANKCDQQKEGLVNTPAKMDEYCNEKNFAGWFETSAKENINIEDAARFLVNKILQNDQIMRGNGTQEQNDADRFALNQSPSSSKKSCSC